VSARLYGRTCALTVGDRQWRGLRVAFKVAKSTSGKPNQAEISIYNLGEESRARVAEHGLAVRLEAGYEEQAAVLFAGELWDAVHKHKGQDWETAIRANDGDAAIRRLARRSWRAGTPKREVVEHLAGVLGVAVSDATLALLGQASYESPITVSGPAAYPLGVIATSLGLEWSIQDGALALVPIDGTTTETMVILAPETGLVGSPEPSGRAKGGKGTSGGHNGRVRAVSLLNPLLRPGRLVGLRASLSGNFRVDKVEHEGDTHDAGKWTSTVDLTPVGG
jgi:hypothetical protein